MAEKAVLMSIHKNWLDKILSGEKSLRFAEIIPKAHICLSRYICTKRAMAEDAEEFVLSLFAPTCSVFRKMIWNPTKEMLS